MKIILTENQFKKLVEGRGGHNKKGSYEDFLDAAKKIHSDENGNPKYDYSLVDYQGSTNKVKVICPKHKDRQLKDTGNEYFEISPDRHIRQGQGCRYCYAEKISKYSEEELEREAKKYKTAAEFKKNSYLHYNSAVKRPELYKKITQHFVSEKESYGERLISKILVDNGLIDSKCSDTKKCPNREKTFEDCKNTIEGQYCRPLRFDFYLPELNTIVEYDGEQHFRPSTKFGLDKFESLQQNDKIKNEYCLKKGIKLIRIHYKFPSEKMEKSLMDALNNSEPITFLGNYKEPENINESFRKTDPLPSFIRSQLQAIYQPLGMWGHAPNPNDDCQTDLGVIGVFPHSKNDIWSILNRFDTNLKVRTKLNQLFTDTNPEDSSSNGFQNWIKSNRDDLFGPNGLYAQQLIDLNLDTIISGNRREEYALEVLQTKFPNVKIKRYCSGDLRDTKKGIDITVEHPTKPFNIQVKPFISVNSYFEPDGDTFFEVKSYMEVNKYSERNVQVFMFVSADLSEYILFKNKKTKIGQMTNNIIRFYEPPLYTNMTLETKQKRKRNKFEDTDKIFGLDTSLEKNLQFRSQTIQKLLQDLKKGKK